MSPEVRMSSVGQDFTLARLNYVLNSTCFSRGHDRAAFVQAFPHLTPCDKDLSMPFFNLQIFVFSDQIYTSSKKYECKKTKTNKTTFSTSDSVKGWIAAEVSEPDPASRGTTEAKIGIVAWI